MAEEVLSEAAQAALRVAEKFTDGRFPEYFTYPERRLLVESDGASGGMDAWLVCVLFHADA